MSEAITVLPDGSAFIIGSFPLPKTHWIYAPRSDRDESRDEFAECPKPTLSADHRPDVEAAVRYAIRGATMCGKDMDFDPDALVKLVSYALCGPFGKAIHESKVEA